MSHDDIGKRYHLKATFELVDPVLSLQQQELALQMFERSLESREGVWEIARKRDTTTLKRQLLDDRVYAMPEVQAELVWAAMQRLGLGELAKRMKQAAAEERAALEAAGGNGAGKQTLLPSEKPQRPADVRPAADAVREMRKPLTGQVPGQPRTPPSARP